MRNLILVAVILQLVIIIIESNKFEFGDIISFERKCPCTPTIYKHYAIYVGDKEFREKKIGQDIFHRIGKLTKPDCVFGELKDQTRGENENYLDSEQRKGTKEEIETRIKEMLNQDNCKKYNLLSNNCEHLATYVRYGEMTSKQPGTLAGRLFGCCLGGRQDCTRINIVMKDLVENEKKKEECQKKCPEDWLG